MRDITIVSIIYCALFIVLTLPSDVPMLGLNIDTSRAFHHFLADLIFWAAALYICASGTMGAFARQDRFGLSQDHPLINRLLSLSLLVSPFFAVLWDVRLIYILLGLLAFSHLRSKTLEEAKIDFAKSRAQSNIILIILFTLALMMMAWHDYQVGSVFDWGSTANNTKVGQQSENA